MIKTLKLNKYFELSDVSTSGFYVIQYDGWSGMMDELLYVNKTFGNFMHLNLLSELDAPLQSILDSEEKKSDNTKIMALDSDNSSGISESLFLKTLAVMRSNDIEINKILN